jgi:hypothetical protein
VARGADKGDPNNPVPNDAPRRKPHEKLAFPTNNRAIFNRVEDFKAVAAEAENADEYHAWLEVVSWAKKFPTNELEQHGATDLTPIDLLKPQRSLYRYDLLRFDGKLVCIRRLEAPLAFKDLPGLGITELYEARLVPVDESPLTPVSIVFTDLPREFADVAKQPFKQWVDRDEWISAAGYYFKTMSVPGEHGNAVVGVPLLVGKSVTVIPGPPAPVYGDPTALDRNVRVYKFIKDESPMIRFDTPWPEIASYNRVIVHASRFTAEQLEEHALPDVTFASLFEDVRRDFKLKNVKMEGRLIRLKRMGTNNELRAAGVNETFEGWLVPPNEPRGNPVCIVFSEPIEGVEPADRVNKWVSFAGFFFKKLRYVSAEQDPKNPNRNVEKYAPLLIGKSPIPRRDPDAPTSLTWGAFVLGAIVGGVVLIAAAGVLTCYYRRGDRQARAEIENVRSRNPFDPAANPPAV